ncbi:hypothetical protein BO83DRAFT_374020 [Aspergillus eucalypticola CBS 122712]|uniref:Uncharacterized protein n=1 Tax=Aspergillus eucalypticola (strain CBS 122712 / IBT 29274) TaxID=1448314 RepID=A0A317WJD1_ASPEC|nr:uncharacterized protein BO83DRAFT_374020 [Aspergillus eucalypticola CBS 122712]PWY85277.1 hypothetical protein BO83DRAFT_374020 [Aspergillus eucalypticola CBS 122712]
MWQQNQDVQRGNQVAVSLDQVDWRFLIPGVSKVTPLVARRPGMPSCWAYRGDGDDVT